MEIHAIHKDMENLYQHSFKWLDMEVKDITSRAAFVKQLNESILELNLNILNTIPFEQLFPLKFIDMITECPDYTFGQPIYTESLNFFTNLLDFFIKFYLKKDLCNMDHIDAEYIESYSPIAREHIVKKNQRNRKFMEKYFNSDFNLHKFAIKLVDKFVVGCTWRWIGSYHKAHIYSVEICKLLMEYGLINDDQIQEIKTMLYSKIQTYKTLENIIDHDAKTIDAFWVNIWIDGLKKVREYYCEILILMIYRKQDEELMEMLHRFYKESKGNDINVMEKKLENIIKFNKSILFEEEFGRKLMDFLLGYILSQNKVNGELLTTPKIEMISDNFLHIFSNIDDPYLHSIKLIKEVDYQAYMQEEQLINDNPLNENIYFASFLMLKILNGLTFGTYLYNNEQILKELETMFEALNLSLDFEIEVKTFDFGKKNKSAIQRIILNTNFDLILLNIFSLMVKHKIYTVELMQKYSLITQFFLLNNTENHCIFLSYQYLDLILKSLYPVFPLQTIEMFLEIFSKYSNVMLMKEFLLGEFLKLYLHEHKNLNNPDGYNTLTKIIDIMSLFINIKATKIYSYIPEYDLRIAYAINQQEQYFEFDEWNNLLRNPQDNEAKLSLFMNTISLIQISTVYRFTNEVYVRLNEAFPLEDMKIFVQLCGNNLLYRSILLDLYANIHIDFKNQLLDNRINYYYTMPNDLQYEEDPYVDKNYDITLKLFESEIDFLLNYWQNQSLDFSEETFLKFANCSLFAAIIKLMNYFLVIKEDEIDKLNKYIEPLEDFLTFLLAKQKIFYKIYTQKDIEFESAKIKALQIQLSQTSERKKSDKLRVLGSCKIILETCQEIILYIPANGDTRRQIKKIVSQKSLIVKTTKAYNRSQNFSNRLQIRKENLKQMTLKREDKFNVISLVALFYEKYKMTKMSTEGEKNVYINSLSDTSKEMTILTYNLCSFIFNQICGYWDMVNKNSKYNLIACLCNTLFISTSSIQDNLYQVIIETNNVSFLDNLWIEMKNSFLYLKFKTNIDKFWNETFTKTIMLMQFHQFLCEDNNVKFKKLFGERILPSDTIDRVQRWTTIFQKLCENCNWHKNYERNSINDFEREHRPYLLPLATKTFDNLAELCTGPCVQNQKKIYTYIYDKYNGVLARYWRDPDTEFYKMKLAILEFMMAMIEGLDLDIVNYQTTNFDLKNINMIMINSLKQLYYCEGLKQKMTGKTMDEYEFRMKDYNKLMHFFESNKNFSHHTLLSICIKLFSYIKILTTVKSKYEIFCKEREEALQLYERKKGFTFKTITEEDLLTYKFLNKICAKVEVVYAGKLVNYYFQTLPKSFYLSDDTKREFLKNVDRSSAERKVSELMASVKYFEIEMDHNQEKYKNFYFFYRFYSNKTIHVLELICLLFCLVINVILLTHYEEHKKFKNKFSNTIIVLASFEIGVSAISLASWVFLNYSLVRKINRVKFLQRYAWKENLNIWDKIYIDVCQSLLLKESVVVFLYHIIMVLLGVNVSYGFLGLDLLSVINLFPTMQYIIKSVTEHASQLISTLILAAIIMFAYGIFMQLYFIDDLASDFSENCSSLAECYFLIVNKAFRNGEGIGGLLNIPNFGDGDGVYYASLIFSLSFFLLINTVFLNVILAVLVDTFSELRGRSDEYSNYSFFIFL